jgi:Ca-activated chloride channel family protein
MNMFPEIANSMHFEIAHKWVFFLLPLPILIYLLLPALHKRRVAMLVPFFNRATHVSGQHPRKGAWIGHKNIISWLALCLCWICLIAAASSPQFVGQPEKKTRTVRSFLIAADISFSMAQRDWSVDGKLMTRWEAVKYLMKDFIKERKSDQVGLEMFATHAYLQAPLTTDLETINWLLDQTEVGMAGQMTSIGEAIAYGIKIFQQDTIKQRVMLLMTDGVDAGKEILPLDAAAAAKHDSVLIYTLGIGNSSSGGYAIDEQLLTQIAETTGGKYFRADSQEEMQQVYTELNKLQPIEYEENTYKPVVLLYMYPLGIAIILSLVFYFLSGSFNLLKEILSNR